MLVAAIACTPVLAFAHGKEEKNKNVTVLTHVEHEELEKSMKSLSKGLGVKCTACHVKGKFDKDDVAAKGDTRKFFEAVVKTTDATERAAALKTLLGALKLEAAKDEKQVWSAVDKVMPKK
jgi:ABC-type uncharacterized transport system substrate-binding protein